MILPRFLECLVTMIYRHFRAQGMGLVEAGDAIQKLLGREKPPAAIDNAAALSELEKMMAGVQR